MGTAHRVHTNSAPMAGVAPIEPMEHPWKGQFWRSLGIAVLSAIALYGGAVAVWSLI